MNIDWRGMPSACYKVAMRSSSAFVLAAVTAFALACTSPTLPLPPPALPTVSVGIEPNKFKLSSVNGAEPNALIIVVNRDEELPRNKRVAGTIADAQGSWDLEVFAKSGDLLDVSQETGTTQSASTTVEVR